MLNITLPPAFKFKAPDSTKDALAFIRILMSQGIQTPCDKDKFITQYVLSGDIYAYSVEDRVIRIYMKNGNEECYANDPLTEIFTSEETDKAELAQEDLTLIERKEIVHKASQSLYQIDIAKLTASDIEKIETFGYELDRMQKKY